MAKPLRVLLLEDSEADAILLLRVLRTEGYDVVHRRVVTADEMRRALKEEAWDIILSDYAMPGFKAPDALRVLQESGVDLPFIIISGTIGEEVAVGALHAGAVDFLLKGRLSRLRPAIERELREHEGRHAQRRAEEELRKSEERYRALFDSSPLPMWVFDTVTLAFLEVNDAAVLHYGYTRAEFLKLTLKDIRKKEHLAALDQALTPEARERGAQGVIWHHRKKDGSEILVEIKAHDFTLHGTGARLVLVNDVTERLRAEEALRKSEEQLRQAQKMEAIGTLAGGVAHDFNNLLSIILSYSSLLLGDMKPTDPGRNDLEEIRSAGQRAAELTKQLLAFSRQQVLETRIVDLNESIGQVDRMIRRIIGEDIELRTVQAKGLWKVKVDPGQVEQVLMNLVVNARDAMPTGGKLTLETANVELDATYARDHIGVKSGPHVMVTVTDTGSGMPKDIQARIFEPFFTTKARGKGTGLGLSTVFGIVKQSGGSIWVDSELGRGTTFKVYFPRSTDAPVRQPSSPSIPAARGAETILLVEDDMAVRKIARLILTKSGYKVLEAANADDAVRYSTEHKGKIHLLLTDVIMPRMSGGDLATLLVSARPEMRVVYMSGYTDDTIVHHGVLEEGVAFLQKPITPAALARKVREALDAPKRIE